MQLKESGNNAGKEIEEWTIRRDKLLNRQETQKNLQN